MTRPAWRVSLSPEQHAEMVAECMRFGEDRCDDWVAPLPERSPCGSTVPRCYRCGKIGGNCPPTDTIDPLTGVRIIGYCGID